MTLDQFKFIEYRLENAQLTYKERAAVQILSTGEVRIVANDSMGRTVFVEFMYLCTNVEEEWRAYFTHKKWAGYVD